MDWKNTPKGVKAKVEKADKLAKDKTLAESLHPDYDLETASWITKKKPKKKVPKLPKNTLYK